MMNFYTFYNGELDKKDIRDGLQAITALFGSSIGCRSKDKFDPVLHIIKKSPYLMYMYARDILKERWEDIEHKLLQAKPEYEFVYSSGCTTYKVFTPNVLVWYAINVMKQRWPEAEELMKHSIDWDSYVRWSGI